MTHYKGPDGFSFMEIILAMAILGIVLTGLFSLQSGVFTAATREHSIISRIFFIKNMFFDTELNKKLVKEKNVTKNLADPVTKLTYQASKPNDKSSLKRFENINLLKAKGSWTLFRDYDETLVTVVFRKPESSEQKAVKK